MRLARKVREPQALLGVDRAVRPEAHPTAYDRRPGNAGLPRGEHNGFVRGSMNLSIRFTDVDPDKHHVMRSERRLTQRRLSSRAAMCPIQTATRQPTTEPITFSPAHNDSPAGGEIGASAS